MVSSELKAQKDFNDRIAKSWAEHKKHKIQRHVKVKDHEAADAGSAFGLKAADIVSAVSAMAAESEPTSIKSDSSQDISSAITMNDHFKLIHRSSSILEPETLD